MTFKTGVLLALGVWNLLVFLTYGLDKQKAKRHAWRIPEKVLLWECILLGGLGAYLGGKIFHHKVRKWYFQVVWYLGLILDGLSLYAILTYLV